MHLCKVFHIQSYALKMANDLCRLLPDALVYYFARCPPFRGAAEKRPQKINILHLFDISFLLDIQKLIIIVDHH